MHRMFTARSSSSYWRLHVSEAKTRLSCRLDRDPDISAGARSMEIDFQHAPDVDCSVWAAGYAFDAVSCMFGVGRFFHSEASATHLMHMVSECLKPGGTFWNRAGWEVCSRYMLGSGDRTCPGVQGQTS